MQPQALLARTRRTFMPKVKPETMTARRDEILEAAESCFARQGFHQTSIQDIIRKSKLSAGCIYNHFPTKDDLIEAIGEKRHANDKALLSVKDPAGNPLRTLRAIGRTLLEDLHKKDGLRTRRVAVELWAEALRSETIRAQVTRGIRGPISVVSELLREGQRLGVVDKKIDAVSFARMIVAMFQGFVLQRVWGEAYDAADALGAFDALLAGLAPRR
jgi:AcrR family transcriptional regulator